MTTFTPLLCISLSILYLSCLTSHARPTHKTSKSITLNPANSITHTTSTQVIQANVTTRSPQFLTSWHIWPRLNAMPSQYDPLPRSLFEKWDQSYTSFMQQSRPAIVSAHGWVHSYKQFSWRSLPQFLHNGQAYYLYALHTNPVHTLHTTDQHTITSTDQASSSSSQKVLLSFQCTHPVSIWIDGVLTYKLKKSHQTMKAVQLSVPSDYRQIVLRFSSYEGLIQWQMRHINSDQALSSSTDTQSSASYTPSSPSLPVQDIPTFHTSGNHTIEQLIQQLHDDPPPSHSMMLVKESWHLSHALPTRTDIRLKQFYWIGLPFFLSIMPPTLRDSIIGQKEKIKQIIKSSKDSLPPSNRLCSTEWHQGQQQFIPLTTGILYIRHTHCLSLQDSWLDLWQIPTHHLTWSKAQWKLSIDLHTPVDQSNTQTSQSQPLHAQSWLGEAGGMWHWQGIQVKKTPHTITWYWSHAFRDLLKDQPTLYWSAFRRWSELQHVYSQLFASWHPSWMNWLKSKVYSASTWFDLLQTKKEKHPVNTLMMKHQSMHTQEKDTQSNGDEKFAFPMRRLWQSNHLTSRMITDALAKKFHPSRIYPKLNIPKLYAVADPLFYSHPHRSITVPTPIQSAIYKQFHVNRLHRKAVQKPLLILWSSPQDWGDPSIQSLHPATLIPQPLLWFGYLDTNQQPRMLNNQYIPDHSIWMPIGSKISKPSVIAPQGYDPQVYEPQLSPLHITIQWKMLNDSKRSNSSSSWHVQWTIMESKQKTTPHQTLPKISPKISPKPRHLWAWLQPAWYSSTRMKMKQHHLITQMCSIQALNTESFDPYSLTELSIQGICPTLELDARWWLPHWKIDAHYQWIKQDLLTTLYHPSSNAKQSISTTKQPMFPRAEQSKIQLLPQQKGVVFHSISRRTHLTIKPLLFPLIPQEITTHHIKNDQQVNLTPHAPLKRTIMIHRSTPKEVISQIKTQIRSLLPYTINHPFLHYHIQMRETAKHDIYITISFYLKQHVLMKNEYEEWNQLVKKIRTMEKKLSVDFNILGRTQ